MLLSPRQNEQFDEDSGSVCFLCLRSSHQENEEEVDLGRRRRKGRRTRKRNHNKSKVDFEQSSGSSNPQTRNAAKRILLKYLVGRCEDEELKLNLISPNSPIKFCSECKGVAKEVQDLHLQLETIQMMLIDKLKQVKENIVHNSIAFQEWSKRSDNDGEEVRRLMQLACQFRTFIGNDGTNQVDVPLVFLEKFVGSKTFPEIVSSTSKPIQAKQMYIKDGNDCQPKTEYIPEQIQEAGDSAGSTVPLKKLQSKLLRGEYEAQVKEELEVDENPAGDDASDIDFDPVDFQIDSDDNTSPELSSTSTTRKAGNNCRIATSDEAHNIRCENCGRMNANFSKLISHSRRRHLGTKLRCALCPSSDEARMYSLREELPRHLDDIHGDSSLRLECDLPSCSQRFYNWHNLKRHKKLDHLKSDNNKLLLQCNSCSESFRSAYSFSNHQMRVHGHSKLKCELCPPSPGRYLGSLSGLSRHLTLFHQKKDAEKFPCSQCPKVFGLRWARNNHEKITHGEKKFSCDKCAYVTSHKGSLETHSRRVHASTSSICEICGFTVKHEDSLRAHHRRMHDPEYQLQRKLTVKKFECSVCPKKFARRGELKSHVLTHSGETPFHCDLCGQAFKRKTNLKQHMLSLHGHGDGDAKHNCSQCSKSFPTEARLRLHMISHTDEKEVACDLCGTKLKRNSALKRHMMNVHAIGASVKEETRRTLVCEECGKDFFDSYKLNRHLLVHAKGGRPRERKRGVRKQVAGVANVAHV